MGTSLIEFKDVSFDRGERRIFKTLNLSVPQGKITAIMGSSGIGKTTLLKLMSGQLKPSEGSVYFDGRSVSDASRKALFQIRERMGMLFQSGALFTDLNVFDNVAFPLREHTALPEPILKTIVLLKLNAVGLRGAASLMPSELSGGMARRVALARALALDPDLIMYDEPFVGQDPVTMNVLVRLIKRLNQALGLTSVVVTHDVEEVMAIADYVYFIADGSVMEKGTPEEIQQSENHLVQQFLSGSTSISESNHSNKVAFDFPVGDWDDSFQHWSIHS